MRAARSLLLPEACSLFQVFPHFPNLTSLAISFETDNDGVDMDDPEPAWIAPNEALQRYPTRAVRRQVRRLQLWCFDDEYEDVEELTYDVCRLFTSEAPRGLVALELRGLVWSPGLAGQLRAGVEAGTCRVRELVVERATAGWTAEVARTVFDAVLSAQSHVTTFQVEGLVDDARLHVLVAALQAAGGRDAALDKLELRAVRLREESLRQLADALAVYGRVTSLEVSHSRDAVSPAGLAYLLQRVGGLEEIKLARLQLDDAAMAVLGPAVAEAPSLRVLGLQTNELRVEGAKRLATAIAASETVRELDVSGNYIGDNGCKALAPLVHRLDVLQLVHTGISANGVWTLAAGLEQPTATLKTLDVSSNLIHDAGLQAISSVLEKSTALQDVSLAQVRATMLGLHVLVQALAANTTLRRLRLGADHAGVEIMQRLATVLGSHATLAVVHLDRMPMGLEQLLVFAKMLETNRVLEELTISFTATFEDGEQEQVAAAFAAAATSNPVLLRLTLLHEQEMGSLASPLSNEQRAQVAHALARNKSRVYDGQVAFLQGLLRPKPDQASTPLTRYAGHSVFDLNTVAEVFALLDGGQHKVVYAKRG